MALRGALALRHRLGAPRLPGLRGCPCPRPPRGPGAGGRRLLPGPAARCLSVLVQSTPNPAARQYSPGQGGEVLQSPGPALDYRNAGDAQESELAALLFELPGVNGVTLAQHFVTVSVDLDSVCWDGLAGHGASGGSLADAVESCIDGFLGSGAAVLSMEAVTRRAEEEEARQAASECEDDGTVRAIKEILENQVRPNIQADGGDVEFVRFDPQSGHLTLRLVGACVSCASSTVTVRYMIKNVICHYVDGVTDVSAEEPPDDARGDDWIG